MNYGVVRRIIALSLLLCTIAAQLNAEVVAAEAEPACCTVPALTEVEIEILAPLNSQANRIGEKFALRLAQPIVIDGKTVVPAGAAGSGDVVHAAKSRFGGKPGEMILTARYIDHQGVRIPLRSLRPSMRGQGKDNTKRRLLSQSL